MELGNKVVTTSQQTTSAVAPSTVESVIIPETADIVTSEKSSESTIRLASFIDPRYSPSYYLERYASEPSYKKWFDDNYAIPIESAVGYSETNLSDFPNSDNPRLYYVERYNNEPSYRTWFDNSFPNDAFESIIGVDSSLGFSDSTLSCSDGKQLVFKTKDMSTICASPTSVAKLLSKGWATSFVSVN